MRLRYRIASRSGSTVVIEARLEDGRGFTTYIGEDWVARGEHVRVLREHAKSLLGVDVESVEEAER
jgi:hypothetical protein